MSPSGDGLSTLKGRCFPAALPLVRLLPDNFGQCALGLECSYCEDHHVLNYDIGKCSCTELSGVSSGH